MSKILRSSIRPLRQLLRYLEDRPRLSISRKPTLQGLPSSILAHIITYLPRECILTLCLTSKRFYSLKPSHKWYNEFEPQEKLNFLNPLVLNLPDVIACPACLQTHHSKEIYHYGLHIARRNKFGKALPCIVEDDSREAVFKVPDALSTTAFRMVMKKYHLQPNSKELLDKISGKGECRRSTHPVTDFFTTEYRIVHGELYHRSRFIRVPRFKYESQAEDICFFAHFSEGLITICPHIEISDRRCFRLPSQIQGYHNCRTEYRISIYHVMDHGVAIILESWRNFGSGPASAAWADHLLSEVDAWPTSSHRSTMCTSYLVRNPSIASVFNDTNNTKNDAWLSQKERLALFQKRSPERMIYEMVRYV